MSFLSIIAVVFPRQEHMNKRQKILTILALAMFAVISTLHYLQRAKGWEYVNVETTTWSGGQRIIISRPEQRWVEGDWRFTADTKQTLLPDLRAPAFILAV